MKENITDYTSLLDNYLTMYYDIIDNKNKNENLINLIESSYENIETIKNSIENFNKNNDTQFIHDAVEIYINVLKPKLYEIINTKYNENFIWFNEDTNNYHLIQKKYSIKDIEIDVVETSIIKNITTLDIKNIKDKKDKKDNKKKPLLIIESSSDTENEDKVNPIFNEDGTINWNNESYQNIWDNLSERYKDALLKDREWLQETMDNYVENKTEEKPIKFINPSNLIIHPQLVDDNYDFCNEIYNDIFNSLDEKYKTTLLNLKKDTNGNINYDLFLDTISEIVAKDLGFTNL